MTLWVIRPSSPLTNPLVWPSQVCPKHNTARRGCRKLEPVRFRCGQPWGWGVNVTP